MLLARKDFDGCELYIHNATCDKAYEVRTVADEDFYSKSLSLCLEAVQFRPVISSDIVLGIEADAFLAFENDTKRYTISFFDAEKQLSLDYIYRDRPMIVIGMAQNKGGNTYKDAWAWYCSLSANDYAQLYELAQTYVGGEIVNGY